MCLLCCDDWYFVHVIIVSLYVIFLLEFLYDDVIFVDAFLFYDPRDCGDCGDSDDDDDDDNLNRDIFL